MENVNNNINDAIQQIIAAMKVKFAVSYPNLPIPEFKMIIGKKYIKLCTNGSVHAFIDFEGNMYKPASWNAPAKGIRFNVVNDLAKLTQIATYSGGYLYK